MKKIAFVVQRYGLEVNGGAELQCRQLAERMGKYYDVEVFATKAIDYVTWEDFYHKDTELINGVLVRRFSVKEIRNDKRFKKLSKKIMLCNSTKEEELQWMKEQGPYSVELIQYIKNNKDVYDVFVFITYLYYTTYFGLQEVADKSILVPTAHDETPIYLSIFKEFFRMPKSIFYNTKEEKSFVERMFNNANIMNNDGLGGVGIDVPDDISGNRFIDKYGISKFVVYIGRIEEHKGCKELFQYFQEYKKRNGGSLKLVLLGKEVMHAPQSDDILNLGFVTEQDKFDALAACEFLILPSQYESLSIVVLEAMKIKKPVLVNGKCDVLYEHCIRSNGGLYYKNYMEFEGCVDFLLNHPEICAKIGENGGEYVDTNYQWDVIIGRLSDLIDCITKESR